MPEKLIDELLQMNAAQADAYHAEESTRHEYRDAHPTLMVVFKCMDGRVHIPVMTKTPFGLIRPKRNIGGVFDMGWPTERARVSALMDYAWQSRRQCLFVATYHYSKSDVHRGCAGHKYDTEAAKAASARLVDQLLFAYRGGLQQNYSIMVGVETDEEALVFHSKSGDKIISMANVDDESEANIRGLIAILYPDMSDGIARDLVPLMRGNIQHVKEVRATPKMPVDLEHRERVIAVGQGFDWLHKINFALIMNDGDPELYRSIGVAASIIKKNREADRIPKSGAVYLVSVPYFRRFEREQAILHAKYLTDLGLRAIKDSHPEDANFFVPLTGIMHWDSRRFEIIKHEPAS